MKNKAVYRQNLKEEGNGTNTKTDTNRFLYSYFQAVPSTLVQILKRLITWWQKGTATFCLSRRSIDRLGFTLPFAILSEASEAHDN